MLTMIGHYLKEQDNKGLYEATAPLLNVFQTAAVLEVIYNMRQFAEKVNL